MNPNKPTNHNVLDSWIDEKRKATASDGFSDRVRDRIARDQTAPEKPLWRSAAFWAKAAILTLALAGGLGRYALLFVCLFTG